MSKLFHLIKVDGEKMPEKIVFGIQTGNVISISCVICSSNTGEYFQRIIWRLTFEYFKNTAQSFYTNIVFEETVILVFDKD